MTKTKFKCVKCGECCKHISDKESKSKGLPLFEWEIENIKKLAEKNKIKIEINPIDLIYDKKSKLYFCTGYIIPIEPCIFLKNNLCLIHKDRPLICKAFPLAKNHEFLEEAPNLDCFSNCPNFNFKSFLKNLGLEEGKPFNLTREELLKKYQDSFDKEILAASYKKDEILEYYSNLINILSQENIIDIELIKKNKNIEPLSLSEFLKKIKIIKN